MAQYGYVQVVTGRKRRFGDVRNMNRRDASQADRQAVNSVIQGTAAELAKLAMIQIDSDPRLAQLQAEMLLQVHDELVLEVPDDPEVGRECMERVKEIMASPLPYQLAVPIPASGGLAYSWAEAK
jgi:DNA polymerase-1